MKKKQLVYGLLCVALVFGLLAMGCKEDEPSSPKVPTEPVVIRPSVTFDLNGGTFDIYEAPASKVIETNAAGTVDFPEVPMKRGEAFIGWFTQDGILVTETAKFDSDTTVYAQWGDQRAYTPNVWNLGLPSLHRLFKGKFLVGNTMDSKRSGGLHAEGIPDTIDIPAIVAMYNHHYNAVSPENSFKPCNIWPTTYDPTTTNYRGGYTNTPDAPVGLPNFSEHDRMIRWAKNNGDKFILGHTLVWTGSGQDVMWPSVKEATEFVWPGWGSFWWPSEYYTREEARANMQRYISTVVGHFAGRIPTWDVVNENMANNPRLPDNFPTVPLEKGWWRSQLNQSSAFLLAYRNGADEAAGDQDGDHIYDAFVFARLADPSAKLYYNDYNEEFPGKREAIAQMIEEINDLWVDDARNTNKSRLLIEGMGMQSHFHAEGSGEEITLENVYRIGDSIDRFAQTGVEISISELDITGRSAQNNDPLTAEEEARQADLYKAIFQIYLEKHEKIKRVTLWGREDATHWRANRRPCIFDVDLRAKDAFFAIAEAAWDYAERERGGN